LQCNIAVTECFRNIFNDENHILLSKQAVEIESQQWRNPAMAMAFTVSSNK
jgi:hypothetical protein